MSKKGMRSSCREPTPC